MSTSALAPGSVIDGYEIVSLLGRGGMGSVYRVRRGEAEYALKTLTLAIEGASEEITRFRREAELLGALRHPGVVRVSAAGHKPGFFYFVMRLIQGESLEDRLKRTGALPLEEAVRIVLAVADTIAHAHELGIIHRDLKPANILMESDGDRPVVTDFGLGRRLGESESERLTRTGEVLGTPAYVAPEQAFGVKAELDEKIDIYGLGALLYATLAGRPPFEGPSALVTMKRVATEPPAPLAGVPPALEAFVLRAMAKRREDRPPTARAFVEELRAATRASPTLPRYVWGLCLLALVLMAAAAALVLPALRPAAPASRPMPVLVASLDSLCRSQGPIARRDVADLARAVLLAAVEDQRAAAARSLARAADESFACGDLLLAARRYEVAHLADRTTLDTAAHGRRLAAWIACGDGDRSELGRYAAGLAGELPAPLLAPCIALVESSLASESDRIVELDHLQDVAEHLPAGSPLRRRVAAAWIEHAARRYDYWRQNYFGLPRSEAQNLAMTRLLHGDSGHILEKHIPKLFKDATPIFDSFGRAVLIDPGQRFPSVLGPCLTLVCRCVAKEKPPLARSQVDWDAFMGRLFRARHPVALYGHARVFEEDPRRRELALEAWKNFDGAPRDDVHVRGLAHRLAELSRELSVPEPLAPLVELANYRESWALLGESRGEAMPPNLKSDAFFLEESQRAR